MNRDPYAPPQVVVADIISGPTMVRPWHVRVAVVLCWLIAALTIPELLNSVLAAVPDDKRVTAFLAAMVGYLIGVIAFIALLNVLMARGYRWARIAFSVVALLDLLTRCQSVLVSFDRGWYLGALNIVVALLDAAALYLLFTRPANAWFRTRGGQIEAP